MLKEGWVYVMASRSRCIYVGVTRDMRRRWQQHRYGGGSEFVRKYQVTRLVHLERFDRLVDALRREKQLKRWRRMKKLALVEQANPEWTDLAEQLGWTEPSS